jgi:ParB family chromosome partitioning protein
MSTILSLDPSTIDPDEAGRIGLFYPAKAEALGFLMQRDGQNDPIKVVRAKASSPYDWTLVSGLHRLKGCLSANIQVLAFDVSDKDDLRGIQASENVDRRELEPLERAMFVHAVVTRIKVQLATQHGDISQHALAGKARALRAQETERDIAKEDVAAAESNLLLAYGWNEQAAEACGYGVDDIKRSMRIYRCIVEPCRDLMDAFKDHSVAKNASALKSIAAEKTASTRRRIIEALIGDVEKTLEQAMHEIDPKAKKEVSHYDKFSNQVRGGWSRLTTSEKRMFIPTFVKEIPPGMRKIFKEELDRLELEGGAS